MKAVICTAYGPPEVLRIVEVEKPSPKKDEILIRIHAATVTRADCELRRFTFPGWIWLPLRLWFGLLKPRFKVLGQEFAGVIEAVGSSVTSFHPGERVCGTTGIGLGAHAEFLCLKERSFGGALARIPPGLGFPEAAALPYGATEALRFLRRGNVQRGQKVLIIGAGGSFGTYAVQLAKFFGAEVTAVDRSAKLETLRSIGADHVIDYTEPDYRIAAEPYDLIFDVVCRLPLARYLGMLRPAGRLVLANPQTSHFFCGLWTSNTTDQKIIFSSEQASDQDLPFLLGLVESGQLRPVLDRAFPLEAMAEAHRYAETEAKVGNIVITVQA